MASEPLLSKKLDELLAQIPDGGFAQKLRRVYQAAASAIDKLADIDLIKYESISVEGAPDLSLWEEMAPVIRDTVVDVNALLMVIRQEFPSHPPGGLGDTLAKMVEEAGGSALSGPARRYAEAESALQKAAQSLAQQVTHLGERMRSPQVVSDRWNLLADLQAFRSRFREEIGALVYDSAVAFGEVSKRDVVPFYAEEVKSAVTVRGTVADLIRVMAARVEKIREAEPEDVQWNARQLEKELDTFGKTEAYRALRAQDKRRIIEFRHHVGEMAAKPAQKQRELLDLVEPFELFVKSLSQVNNRELLIEHDREVTAECGVLAERARALLGENPEGAAAVLKEAALRAQALYGRSAELDAFLRRAKKQDLATLGPEETQDELEKFLQLIASLPLY